MAIRKPLLKKPGTSSASASAKTTVRRPSSSKPASQKPAPRASNAGMARGSEGFGKAREQQARQQEEFDRKKERPYPFRITQKDITAKKNVVDLLYLDTEPFFVRLHTVPNGRGGYDDEVCLADTGEPCPLCRKLGKEGAWTLVLTALDKRPYRNREGKLIKQSKKLVYVKSRNIDKYERQYNRHKTFRGMVVTHRRHGAKEASIGEDLEFKSKLVPGAVIAKNGDLAKVTDYAKAFAPLTVEAMESKYANVTAEGGGGGGGRRGGNSDDDDDAPQW